MVIEITVIFFTIWFVITNIMIVLLRRIGVELKKTNFLLDQLGKGLLGWGDQR